jgi:hypothetical protein
MMTKPADLDDKRIERTNYRLEFFDSHKDLNYVEKLKHFIRAPVVKFFYNQV